MMVIKTETLTSTSHHDIFTNLDYIFSCYLHIYVYIYINIKKTDLYDLNFVENEE